MEVGKFFVGSRDAYEYHYTRALMQVCMANDPVPCRIGLATNHTSINIAIAANKVLFHSYKECSVMSNYEA